MYEYVRLCSVLYLPNTAELYIQLYEFTLLTHYCQREAPDSAVDSRVSRERAHRIKPRITQRGLRVACTVACGCLRLRLILVSVLSMGRSFPFFTTLPLLAI